MTVSVQAAGRKEKMLLERLSHGLSEEEIRRVIGSALTTLDRPKLERLCARLGPETGPALRRILRSSKKSRPPRHSSDKVRQDWDQAWAEWGDHISDACLEDGPYVIQDHHWEQPYFDPGSVASDLEPIAAKMRKLLPRVFDDGLDPDFSFSASVKESVEEISTGLPEWLNPFEADGFGLGPQATGCLLEWEWRAARRAGRTAFHLLDDIRRLEASVEGLYLDEGTVVRFVRALRTEDKKEIQRGIQLNRQENHWRKALDSAHSPWFRIYKDMCRGYDPSSYLENCRAKIDQDWTLALPVIRNLQRRKEHSKVAEICGRALRSFLRLREEEKWDPGENLIGPLGDGLYEGKSDSRLMQILDAWEKSVDAMGQGETAAALRLQADLLVGRRNWDKALAAFRRAPLAQFTRMQQRLFEKWRDQTAKESLPDRYVHGWPAAEHPESSHWVHALVDAAWKGPDGSAAFTEWVRGWFRKIDAHPESIGKNLNALARLTLDMDSAGMLRREFPTLARLLACGWNDDPALRASRRRWLERSGGHSLMPELLSLWRRRTERLVPDPQKTESSNYDDCADWVRALHEIQPAACRNLITRWGTPHRRRKNLWRALRKRGLSESK